MNKSEFLAELEKALAGLPKKDVDERLAFFSEMIDDRMEEGLGEEEAVQAAGSIDEIVSQTVADVPLGRLVNEKMAAKRKMRGWEIALLVLGFPLWFALLVAAGAIILSLYIALWSLVISLWAIELSLWAFALGGITLSIVYFVKGNTFPALMILGFVLFAAGLSIFMFYACIAATKGAAKIPKLIAAGIKSSIVRKGRAK